MTSRLTYVLRVSTLVLYGVYAMSPLYKMLADEPGKIDETVGIVWVKMVLSELSQEDNDNHSSQPVELSMDDPQNDFVLVRKKRAVLRENLDFAPCRQEIKGALSGDLPPLIPTAFLVPLDLTEHRSDDYTSLHQGLSPPLRSA